MTDLEFAKIEVALKSKPAQALLDWDEVRELYFMVLGDIPSVYVPGIMRWIVTECKIWRPTTDQVYDFCQKIGGNTTIQGATVVREVRDAIREFGINAKPHPERPTITIEGPPPTLSEAALRFVDFRGGWPILCTEQYRSEEFYIKQCIEEASEICDQIRVEAAQRSAVTPKLRREISA